MDRAQRAQPWCARLLCAALLLFITSFASWTQAAAVAIEPVRVQLSETVRSQSLHLHNNGSATVRFQVTAFGWQQSPSGEMQLTPTTDLVFFPSLLELKPGESRRIRVTTTLSAGAVERSYRLFVEELPPIEPNKTGAVTVLTRLGLPVFIQPATPAPKVQLALRFERDRMIVTLSNGGNSFFLGHSVRVVGRSKAGTVTLEETLPAWYVLTGGSRVFEIPYSAAACEQLDNVTVTADTDHETVTVRFVRPGESCAEP